MQIGVKNEVMVAISNRNYAGKGSMLDIWIRNVKRSNVTNAMVVALDEETQKFAEAEQIPSLVMSLKVKLFKHGCRQD